MPIDFTPLRKILKLEQEKGYSNGAVFGGLDKFLAKWAAQSEQYITNPALLKRFKKLNSLNYAALDEKQRRKQMENILAFVDDIERQPIQKSKAKPAPAKKAPVRKLKAAAITGGISLDFMLNALNIPILTIPLLNLKV